MKKQDCPKCGSRNTKKCSTAYELGVSTMNNGVVRISALARRIAPPKPPLSIDWERFFANVMAFVLAVVGVLVWAKAEPWFTSLVFSGAIGLVAYYNSSYIREGRLNMNPEMKKYRNEMIRYQKLWVCLDCATIYIPEE